MKYLLYFFVLLVGKTSATRISPSIQEVFEMHQLVPQIIPKAPKNQLMVVNNDGSTSTPGAIVAGTVYSLFPFVTWEGSEDAYYLYIVFDADHPYAHGGNDTVFVTYLVANICGVNVPSGDTLSALVNPSPIPGNGYQRFVGLIYKQKKYMTVTTNLLIRVSSMRDCYSMSQVVKDFDVGDPIAGTLALSRSMLERSMC